VLETGDLNSNKEIWYCSLPQYRIYGHLLSQILNNQLPSSLTLGVNMLVIKKQRVQMETEQNYVLQPHRSTRII